MSAPLEALAPVAHRVAAVLDAGHLLYCRPGYSLITLFGLTARASCPCNILVARFLLVYASVVSLLAAISVRCWRRRSRIFSASPRPLK